MKVLVNPLDRAISIMYGGVTYTVRANSYLEITKDNERAVQYWVTTIHQFLKIKELDEINKPKAKAVEKKVEESKVEEKSEEVIKEKVSPKKQTVMEGLKKKLRK